MVPPIDPHTPKGLPSMVNLNNATYCELMGNTYVNREEIKALGASFDNANKCWKLPIERHPLNNPKQRKKLVDRLTALEERGVQVLVYRKDSGEF